MKTIRAKPKSFKFQQRSCVRGRSAGIKLVVSIEPGFPISPDEMSRRLGYFIGDLTDRGTSYSIETVVDPWPLPWKKPEPEKT